MTPSDQKPFASGRRPGVCIVLHAYQPASVSDAEVEQTVRTSYQPAVALHRVLQQPLTLNVQGCLLERLRCIAPAFLDQLRGSIELGLVEVTASAYGHPCLPLLPRERRRIQIDRNQQTVLDVLGVRPRGFWPPELAWTPALHEQLVERSIRWTIVDGSALVRSWSFESRKSLRGLYVAAELMRPYRMAGDAQLIAVPRQHEWSRRVFEGPALINGEERSMFIDEFRAQAQGLICLAADAERIALDAVASYEHLLRALADSCEFLTVSGAVMRFHATEPAWLPVWSWRGALDHWIRGEGERSFLRELDDARDRYAKKSASGKSTELAAEAGELLMKAESSCWLFWRTPCTFLNEGFALVGRVHDLMDQM